MYVYIIYLAGAESEVQTSRVCHVIVQSRRLYSVLGCNQFQTQQMSVYGLTRYSLNNGAINTL